MPWICEECGALEDGDMCRSCGNIAPVKIEAQVQPETMFANQGFRTLSSFKYHAIAVGVVSLAAATIVRVAAVEGLANNLYALSALLLAPLWVPPVHHAIKRIQESYYRWKFRDRL